MGENNIQEVICRYDVASDILGVKSNLIFGHILYFDFNKSKRYNMLDYTIEDAQRILKSFNSSELRLDSHVLDNWFERDINFDYIFECLNDKI